ncbi:sigma 54-interacting transcriptional regulator [candidate division WOR-3 bacterium]|nr:sigma 54-interacting transcriptional regulator [candidate division WOR-3 bacterium]
MPKRPSKNYDLPNGFTQLKKLGEGAGSVVLAVKNETTGKELAFKLATRQDPTHRLEQEFAILARLDHPGIVRVYESGFYKGCPYFTMELIKGKPFNRFMDEHRSEPGFIELFLGVLGEGAITLADIHQEGVVHADIKPANLLVQENGKPVLLDFGFAEDYLLSHTAEPRGTLDYVAPELFLGREMSPAADVYSLGAMAYEGLTGKILWGKKSLPDLIRAKFKTPPGFSKQKPEIWGDTEELILRMLQPDPALRPAAGEILTVIEKLIEKKERIEVEQPGIAPRLCFGGREEELSELERSIFEEKRALLLEGSSGIGKTRLLREFLFRALLQHHNTLLVTGRAGYLSLTEHLAAALGLAREQTHAEEREHRYEMIFQAARKAQLDAVMIDAPTDLSPDEEECLGFLARGFEGKIGVVIPQVPQRIHPSAYKIELKPLKEETILEMVSRTFEGLREKNALASALTSIGEGNPRRMNELLEVLYHEGWLRRKKRWVYESPVEEKNLAEKLAEWLGARIEGLPEESKLVLSTLATAEGPLPSPLLQSALGKSDTPLILLNLTNVGLVHSFPYRNVPHYELKNDLVGQYASAALAAKDKKNLSKKLAEALEDMCREIWNEDPSAWDNSYLVHLASLYFKAGVMVKARRYLVPAAKRLAAAYDFDQARGFLKDALSAKPARNERMETLLELGRIANIEHNAQEAEGFYTQALPLVEEDLESEADILLRIGLAYQRVKDLDRAQDFFNRSEEFLKDSSSALKYQLLSARGWNALERGKLNQAQTFFQQSMKIASSSYEQRSVQYDLAWTLFLKRNPSEALKYARTALELSEIEDDKSAICRTSLLVADVLNNLGRLKEAEDHVERALGLTRKMGYPIMTSRVLHHKAQLFSKAGRYREARSVAHQAIEVLGKLKDRYQIALLALFEAQRSMDIGDWERAEQGHLELWQATQKTSSLNSLAPYVLQSWAELHRLKGRPLPAKRMLVKAKALASSRGDESVLPWIGITHCRISLAEGDYSGAKKLLKGCKSLLDKKGDVYAEFHVGLLETEISLWEGKDAVKSASELIKGIEKNGFENLRGKTLRLLGRALIASDRFREGLVKLHESAEVLKSQEALYEQGLSLYTIAEAMFEKTGYTEESISILQEAQIIFERIGAARNLQRIKSFRAEHFADWRKQAGLPTEYLKSLKRVSELINYRLGEENFMLDLLAIVLELTGAERGMVFMMDEDELYSVASKRMDTTTTHDARRISRTVIRRIQHGLKSIYTPDATKDGRFNRSQSIMLNDIRSLMCIPLRTSEKLIGTIYLDSREIGLFDAEKTLYFDALGNLLAATIDKSAEFARLREELVLARKRKPWEETGIVIGTSPAISKLCSQLERIAQSDTNILLEGETGTGKGVFANMIHEQSPRRKREFCSINCGILPEGVFESELFGHRKGAYTGATEDRLGLLEAADGSTVFFDEITNTSLAMQAKLLEVIEERIIRRLGESKKRYVNLRFIVATNRDLKDEVREGRFRDDLYFRINTVTLSLPPLRERREDIPEFINFFLKKFSTEFNKNVTEIANDVMQALITYPWPGNIRELANVIERAILLARGRVITRDLLDQRFFPVVPHTTKTLREARQIEEKELIRRTLFETRGNVTRTARRLGISRQHLSRLLKCYEIPRKPR